MSGQGEDRSPWDFGEPTLDAAIAEARSVCDDDAAPFCNLKHSQVADWLEELKRRREEAKRMNPFHPQLGSNLGSLLGNVEATEARFKKLVVEALSEEVAHKVAEQLVGAQRVMANDQVIVAHLVNVIAKQVPREHWPRIVHEFAGANMMRLFGGGELKFDPSPKMIESILAEAIEEVDPTMEWCDACGSYHAPQNPTCRLKVQP